MAVYCYIQTSSSYSFYHKFAILFKAFRDKIFMQKNEKLLGTPMPEINSAVIASFLVWFFFI